MTTEELLARSYAIVSDDKGFYIFSKYRKDTRRLEITAEELDFCGNNVDSIIREIEKKTQEYFNEPNRVRCFPEGTKTVQNLKAVASKNFLKYNHFDNE